MHNNLKKQPMNNNKINIHFLGAAGMVTDSKYLVDTGEKKIIVDCGFFQGLNELRLKNWEYLPVEVLDIDVILLIHGHLNHTGYLPRLVKQAQWIPLFDGIRARFQYNVHILGATYIELDVHRKCFVFSDNAYQDLLDSREEKIVTCNTIPHLSNAIDLSDVMAKEVKKLIPHI